MPDNAGQFGLELPDKQRMVPRWLFGTECLLTQGFPVHPLLHKDYRISCFNFPRKPGDRKPRAVCAQAGNSMNVVCPLAAALYGICNWQDAGSISASRTACW